MIFGWCLSGAHEGRKLDWQTPCKGEYHRVIKETHRRGRKTIEKVLVDEMVYCACDCHGKDKPTKKTRKRKR